MTQWIVLRTAPMRERWVAAELRRGLGLASYVPIERVKHTNGRTVHERVTPLMRGYSFVGSIHAAPLNDIRATRHVQGWLYRSDPERPAILTDAEIDRIRQLERELNNASNARPRQLQAGDRVRVTKGAFQDMETLITAICGNKASLAITGAFGKVSAKLDALEAVA